MRQIVGAIAMSAGKSQAAAALLSPLPQRPFSTPSLIHVIAECDDWIVVNKPPHLEVHPSKPNGRRTLWDGLRELLAYELVNGGQVSIINRLDRETSGLTLIAKHRTAARALHGAMESRSFEKEYLALVFGWSREDEFVVDAPLLRQGEREPSKIYLKQAVHPDGAAARTRFRVEERRRARSGAPFSLIRAFPETGRLHQIRVHLAHAGHPVVGDKIYGRDEDAFLDFIDTGWTPALAERLLLSRHALHSTVLHLPSWNLMWHSPLAPDITDWMGENFLADDSAASL